LKDWTYGHCTASTYQRLEDLGAARRYLDNDAELVAEQIQAKKSLPIAKYLE
jgi:hypothetical protein